MHLSLIARFDRFPWPDVFHIQGYIYQRAFTSFFILNAIVS